MRLSSDDWSEVGDLIDQCIETCALDGSYSPRVRGKAITMLIRLSKKAVGNWIRLKRKLSTECADAQLRSQK